MTSFFQGEAATRYGCLECREDAELVVCDRIHPEGLARYHAHVRGCDACRRAHQLLVAVYRGPDPGGSGVGMVARDREFTAIVRRVRRAEAVRKYRRQAAAVAVAGLAAVVALVVFVPDARQVEPPARESAPRLVAAAPTGAPAVAEPDRSAGLDHSAQADYGRVVAGSSFVAEGERPSPPTPFRSAPASRSSPAAACRSASSARSSPTSAPAPPSTGPAPTPASSSSSSSAA
jgi:hypothetical protein